MANTLDDYEAARRRFLTECQIIASMHSEKSHNLRRRNLKTLREGLPVQKGGYSGNLELNRLLDNLAFLLVQKRGGDCVSLALVGFTRDKIDLVAQTSSNQDQAPSVPLSPQKPLNLKVAANHRSEDSRANLELIRQHALRIFELVREHSTIHPGNPRGLEIFRELLTLQFGYSSDKLYSRVSQLKKFTGKVEGLPSWASLSVGKCETEDKFSIPSVLGSQGEDLGSDVLTQLYTDFSRQDDSVSLPPIEEMLVLNTQNFDLWTRIFLRFLTDIRKEVKKLNLKRSQVNEEGQISLAIAYMQAMEELVTQSQLFRRWVEVTTRTLDEKERQLKEEEEEAKEKLRDLARLKQPENVAAEDLEVNPEGAMHAPTPEQNQTIPQQPRNKTSDAANIPSQPQGGHDPRAPVSIMESDSSALNQKPRMRDRIKMTLRKVVPTTIVSRFTSKPRRLKEPPTHIKDIFGGPSQPLPGGNEGDPGASRVGGQEGTEELGAQPAADEGQADAEHQNVVGVSTQSDSRVPKIKPKVSHQSSIGDSFLEEDEGQEGYRDEAEAVTAVNQSIDFNILWLIPQHMMAIRSILGSAVVQKLASSREFNLEVLPYDDEEPTTLPCEPLRGALARLLAPADPLDIDQEKRIDRFLAHAKPYKNEISGSKWLLALNTETPTVKVSGHAELLLLSHLQQLKRTSQYPYPYIGLSKPPCLVCEAVILMQEEFPIMTQKGHTHAYVSNIPRGISQEHQRYVFGFIRNLAKEVCQDFYIRKRRDSRDSHYIVQDTPQHTVSAAYKFLGYSGLRAALNAAEAQREGI